MDKFLRPGLKHPGVGAKDLALRQCASLDARCVIWGPPDPANLKRSARGVIVGVRGGPGGLEPGSGCDSAGMQCRASLGLDCRNEALGRCVGVGVVAPRVADMDPHICRGCRDLLSRKGLVAIHPQLLHGPAVARYEKRKLFKGCRCIPRRLEAVALGQVGGSINEDLQVLVAPKGRLCVGPGSVGVDHLPKTRRSGVGARVGA